MQQSPHRDLNVSEDILDHFDGGLLTITLNRPEEGNGLNDTAIAELTALLQGAAARARLVVSKAAGKDFFICPIAPRGAAPPKIEALASCARPPRPLTSLP